MQTHNGNNRIAASLSPALRDGPSATLGPAYEIKFLVTEEQAREIEQRLLLALLPDPHSDPALAGMYAIASLVCDGPGFGVFFRDERMQNRKYRVRRYGGSGAVYLERKQSSGGKVCKHRVAASLEDLGAVGAGSAPDAAHDWFVRELRADDLAPVCRVRYQRRALFGVCAEGAMRVTLDRCIRGALAPGWALEFEGEERALLEELVVCEFKFHNSMPAPLKAVVAAMKLEATGFSKYRACVRAFATELGVSLPARAVVGTDGPGVEHA